MAVYKWPGRRLSVTACTGLSALLFFSAHPTFLGRYGFWAAAWFFAIPLFFALEGRSVRARLAIGTLFGCLVYLPGLAWFFRVTVPGAFLFFLALSVQPVLFSLLYISPAPGRRGSSVDGTSPLWRPWFVSLYVPALWVSTEYARALLLGGFTWSLAYTQCFNPTAVQIADITGVYGVSFALIFVNHCLYRLISEKVRGTRAADFAAAALMLFAVFGYGYACRHSGTWGIMPFQKNAAGPADGRQNSVPGADFVRVAIVQGNADPYVKWDDAFAGEIMRTYVSLTGEAARARPGLIIWPETSLPGDYYGDDMLRARVTALAYELDTALLIGVTAIEGEDAFNSAFLIGNDGALRGVYNKNHLIPFAEYTPPGSFISRIGNIMGIRTTDFTAGKGGGLFDMDAIFPGRGGRDGKFGVTICSEDMFPGTVRKLVDNGAVFVINITNDAWFGRSGGAYMHLQAAVMRAVENRVPVVRSANTGWSCFINSTGGITDAVGHPGGYLYVSGHASSDVIPAVRKTVYRRGGYMFPYICAAFCAAFLALVMIRRRDA